MPTENIDALVDETKALIDEVESGRPEHAAWIAIQDRVRRLYDSRTQAEVGELLGKVPSWVGEVLAFDRARDQSPFGKTAHPHKAVTRDRAAAKRMLRDPEQRRKVVEALDPDEQLALANDAVAASARDDRRRHKEREAHRDERPARERGVIEIISTLLDGADANIVRAVHVAGETSWDDAEVNAMAEGRIDRTAMRLDLLRMAVAGDGDLDAELARIEAQS